MATKKALSSSVVRTPTQPVRLDQGETVHVGVRRPQGDLSHRPLQRLPRAPGHLGPARSAEVLIERLRPIQGQVVYEAGPTGFGLARRLRAEGFAAEVIAPPKLLTPVGPEAKCDRLDCRRLSFLSSKGLLHPVRVPTEQEEADRQVLRVREQLARKARSVQQQIEAPLLQHGIAEPDGLGHWAERAIEALCQLEPAPELRFCLDVMLDELDHAQGRVKRVTKRLEGLARAERHRAAAGVMRSVPGVGLVTAMTLMVRQSGETRREGGLIRSSSALLRTTLVEAAWRWVACDEAAKAVYRRLVGNTGSGKEAIIGLARRLGVLLWRLSCRGQPSLAAA